MFELTIGGTVYQFKFGLGFAREIDKKKKRNVNGVEQDAGLQFAVASVIDQDPVALVDILNLANKGMNPRVTDKLLDAYLEDEETDIDQIFEDVLDFLRKANATKKATAAVEQMVEQEMAKAAQTAQ